MQIHAGQTKGWWNECPGLLTIRTKRFAVFVQFRIKAPRPPSGENFPDGICIDTEEIGKGLEIRRQRHNRADVQISIGPGRI